LLVLLSKRLQIGSDSHRVIVTHAKLRHRRAEMTPSGGDPRLQNRRRLLYRVTWQTSYGGRSIGPIRDRMAWDEIELAALQPMRSVRLAVIGV
jgi:hypothetical protein